MVEPQVDVRAEPTGREGGEVMRPWQRTVVGRRDRRAEVEKCMV